MNKILLGTICGIIFGIIAVLTMIPLQFEDKRRAMTGAFGDKNFLQYNWNVCYT